MKYHHKVTDPKSFYELVETALQEVEKACEKEISSWGEESMRGEQHTRKKNISTYFEEQDVLTNLKDQLDLAHRFNTELHVPEDVVHILNHWAPVL